MAGSSSAACLNVASLSDFVLLSDPDERGFPRAPSRSSDGTMLHSSPSSIASASDDGLFLDADESMLANGGASIPLLLPPPHRASPRLANIMSSFECPHHEGIISVHDAAAMPEDTLGELTEAVRGVSLEILMLASSTPASSTPA